MEGPNKVRGLEKIQKLVSGGGTFIRHLRVDAKSSFCIEENFALTWNVGVGVLGATSLGFQVQLHEWLGLFNHTHVLKLRI